MTDAELIANLRRRASDEYNPLVLRDLYTTAAGRLEDGITAEATLERIQRLAADVREERVVAVACRLLAASGIAGSSETLGKGSIAHGRETDTIGALVARQIPWSFATFGPGFRTDSITRHIEKECAEVRAKATDLVEWVDIILLAIDGFWRAGGQPHELLHALEAKQTKNMQRRWIPGATQGEPHEHDRTLEPDGEISSATFDPGTGGIRNQEPA